MLVESLIRLGRPFIEGDTEPLDLLRQASDVTDARGAQFLPARLRGGDRGEGRGAKGRRSSLGLLGASRDGRPGGALSSRRRTSGRGPFCDSAGESDSFSGMLSGSVYIVYAKDFLSFRGAPGKVKAFLRNRVRGTVSVNLARCRGRRDQ